MFSYLLEPHLSLQNYETRNGMFHHPALVCEVERTLDFGIDQVKGQGQGHKKVKNYWTELHKIFRDNLSSSKEQSIRFWERSHQRRSCRKKVKLG